MDRAIWIDGEVKSWDQAESHPFTFTTMYGYGVFEGIRSYDCNSQRLVFRLQDHIDRLLGSAKKIGIKHQYTSNDIQNAIFNLLKNVDANNTYIRPMIVTDSNGFLGIKAPSLSANLIMAVIPWVHTPSAIKKGSGLNLQSSHIYKPPNNASFHSAKTTGNYLASIIALQQIDDPMVDDLIFYDQSGFVAEASGANIFIVKNSKIFSPFCHAALKGITRDTIIKLAERLQLMVEEKNLTKDDLYNADEIFLTGTAIEVMGVTKIDGLTVGLGKQGQITSQFSEYYHKITHDILPDIDQTWLLAA